MRPVDDFTRPEVFLEEKSWPGLVACSQRPVLLIICEHTLPAHYHKEANTEGTHEIKVSLLKVIHNSLTFIDKDLHHCHSNGDEDAVEGHPLAPHTNPASICHHQRPTTGVTRSEAKPRLAQLDGYEVAAWNDYEANAGAVIKNLILSTWARPL